MSSLDRVVRPKEAEELSGYTFRHLRNMEKAGQFPARFKLNEYGRAVGYKLSSIQNWLEERAASGGAI